VNGIQFIVEQAGCASCAAIVREALTPIAEVHEINVDETADCAAVRVGFSPDLSQEAVGRALLNASTAAGHEYRVKPGSWRSESSA
jgi:hypothetical protein